MEMGKIVVVDDEKIVTSAFSTLLKVEGFSDAHFFNNPKDAILLPNFSCHILRHTFTTRMCEAGINIKAMQEKHF